MSDVNDSSTSSPVNHLLYSYLAVRLKASCKNPTSENNGKIAKKSSGEIKEKTAIAKLNTSTKE